MFDKPSLVQNYSAGTSPCGSDYNEGLVREVRCEGSTPAERRQRVSHVHDVRAADARAKKFVGLASRFLRARASFFCRYPTGTHILGVT